MNDDKKKVVEELVNNSDREKEEKKEKEGKSLFSKIMNIVLWILLLGWMGICLFDFYNVTNEKEPKFCIKKETTEYEDGTVDSCLGLGYKVYNYNRDSYTAIEFGPFWAKDRSNKQAE